MSNSLIYLAVLQVSFLFGPRGEATGWVQVRDGRGAGFRFDPFHV